MARYDYFNIGPPRHSRSWTATGETGRRALRHNRHNNVNYLHATYRTISGHKYGINNNHFILHISLYERVAENMFKFHVSLTFIQSYFIKATVETAFYLMEL